MKGTKGKYVIENIHVTSTVSMALVLFMVGMVSLILFAARDTAREIKENINLSLILDDKTPDENVQRIEQYVTNSGYAKSTHFISKDEALKEHISSMGENPEDFLGYNPLMASIEVKLNADHANNISVRKLKEDLAKFEHIKEVAYQEDIIDLVDNNIQNISMVLLSFAAILMLISFALINNTIKVSIYANRFLINTMQLVGATAWFIRKPYVKRGMINGFLAALIALIMLTVMSYYMQHEFSMNFFKLSFTTLSYVTLTVVVTGMALSALSSYLAVGKYLRMKTNDMYFV